jgi:predicted ATPase
MIPQIKQVWIQNYKSIEEARVTLEPFTVLVGANSTGKSNFIDALEFVKDCIEDSVPKATNKRGGFDLVATRFRKGEPSLGISITAILENDLHVYYGIKIDKYRYGERVLEEKGLVYTGNDWKKGSFFKRNAEGQVATSIEGYKVFIQSDRLGIQAMSGTKEFRPVYEFLNSMRFYSIQSQEMRAWQQSGRSDVLLRDGSNAAAVVRRLSEESGQSGYKYNRIRSLLGHIASGIIDVSHINSKYGNTYEDGHDLETLLFHRDINSGRPLTLTSASQSDGTLRALGVLLAIYQLGNHSVIAIEEPEATIHPAASEVLLQAFKDAAHDRQIIITTHSADLLDNKEVTSDIIRVVGMEHGRTFILPVSEGGKSSIRDHLFTAGELLRVDELNPDRSVESEVDREFDLFDESFKTGRESE